MKRLFICFLTFAATFFLGFLPSRISLDDFISVKIPQESDVSLSKNLIQETKDAYLSRQTPYDSEFLDSVWMEQKQFSYKGFLVSEGCPQNAYDDCYIRITRNGIVLAEWGAVDDKWLKYGFYNFLGGKDKQLIVHSYSGGAHCCYDYAIYDLQPRFRVIYDSTKLDSGNDIGNALVPVDIDGDGISEFRQDVMAFDYFWASHADATFPPAIFQYDKVKGKYILANKKFPDYVLALLKENLDGHPEWLLESYILSGVSEDESYVRRMTMRENFLYMVYAGKKEEAWKYFEDNYGWDDKVGFRKDFSEQLRQDPTYRSIYGTVR